MSGSPDNKPKTGAATLPPDEIKRIKDNLFKIVSGGGSEDDANRYLASEGVTPDEIKNNDQVAMVLLGSSGPDAFTRKD